MPRKPLTGLMALPKGPPPPRPVIVAFRPSVDGGRYAAKAVSGEVLRVEADVIADGHDLVSCELRYRHTAEGRVQQRALLDPVGNDTYATTIVFERLGRYELRVHASLDHFATWRHEIAIRAQAGEALDLELAVGAQLVAEAARRARGAGGRSLGQLAAAFAAQPPGLEQLLEENLAELMRANPDPDASVLSDPYPFEVERLRAAYGSWYELFPRSASPDPARSGTLADVRERLAYVGDLGADVLYLPPVHPIGHTARKGANGATGARPSEPGSPWAIGSAEGGHTAIDPALGDLHDFDELVAAAAAEGIEIAIDLALQCSPEHPWVTAHPEWFRHRPDGSIRYAENPPKRYEDIYPIDFETPDWRALWEALAEVVEFWVFHGVLIFRVDNPHTKAFAFWEWLIARIRAVEPRVVFLAEAFTRPKTMYHLAKIGFSQSYTYFTWRNSKYELESYLAELTSPEVAAFFRPNFWPNTPDILTAALQEGGRPAFALRVLLAGTLGANYGVYGPAFELGEHVARSAGSEEYLDSEKYQVRHWDLEDPNSLTPLLKAINAVRRGHVALHQNATLRFHRAANPELLVYSKTAPHDAAYLDPKGEASTAAILCVVNLDPHYSQSGWVELDLDALGLEDGSAYLVHDLLSATTHTWKGASNFVILDPHRAPGHLFEVRAEPAAPHP